MQAAAIAEQVQAFFQERGWVFDRFEARPGSGTPQIHYCMGMGLSNGTVRIITQIVGSRLEFLTQLAFTAPEARRGAMAEAMTRANYGRFLGNFEMDFRDGELRYRTSMDSADGELTREMVARLYHLNAATVDRYLPALQQVAMSETNPALAIEAVERESARLERMLAEVHARVQGEESLAGDDEGTPEDQAMLDRLAALLADLDIPEPPATN